MDKQDNIMLLCDTEEEYVQLFGEYIRKQKEYPWEIHIYTDIAELLQAERRGHAAMLVVSETAYREEMKSLQSRNLIILNESGQIRWKDVHYVDKYQCADRVLSELLEIYAEEVKEQLPVLQKGLDTKFIGMYSPVRRCHQTTFALAFSQMLSREHKTLYINFEHYVGITELIPDMQTRDLADLLYFLTAEEDKFRLRIRAIIQHKGPLDYIPPMKTGQNLLSVTAAEWMNLLQQIGRLNDYEYVVLDLSESMQGLFDILRICERVYTLTARDKVAQCKIKQYEQVLALYEYEDVLQNMRICMLPEIRKIPEDLAEYTRGELAEYVKRELKELPGCGKGQGY